MLTLRQLIRRPQTDEEAAGQAAFYRSIAFGTAIQIIAFVVGWFLVGVIRG